MSATERDRQRHTPHTRSQTVSLSPLRPSTQGHEDTAPHVPKATRARTRHMRTPHLTARPDAVTAESLSTHRHPRPTPRRSALRRSASPSPHHNTLSGHAPPHSPRVPIGTHPQDPHGANKPQHPHPHTHTCARVQNATRQPVDCAPPSHAPPCARPSRQPPLATVATRACSCPTSATEGSGGMQRVQRDRYRPATCRMSMAPHSDAAMSA